MLSLEQARQVFGVAADASQSEIKKRYNALAIEKHPDHPEKVIDW
jgi:DnaJ-class molecular chaperone